MILIDAVLRLRHIVRVGLVIVVLGALSSSADERQKNAPDGSAAGAHGAEHEPTGSSLNLRDALAISLSKSPGLASYSLEIRAAEARQQQIGMISNPLFRVDFENIGGSGPHDEVENAETTLMLSQLIELGGKRHKRRSVGGHEVKVAEHEYEATRLAVVAETTSAFVDALARQEDLRLAKERIGLVENALREMQGQVRAGAASSAELILAELEVRTQQLEGRLRQRALRASHVRLATELGETEPRFTSLQGDLNAVESIPQESELVARLAASPQLARWQAAIAARQAALSVEDARRIPDVTIGLGSRHFNETDDWAVVAGIELPIPIFDRNQGGRRESQAALARSRKEQRVAELRLRRLLAESYQGLASSWDEVAFLRDDAIPTAEATHEVTRRAYRAGALRLAEVLDSQDALFGLRTRLVEVLSAYHLSRAEIEALIGGALDPEREPSS